MLSPQVVNVVSFYFNVIVSYGIGVQSSSWSSKLNLKTIKQISEKYPTLITPCQYAFSIMGLIFVLEAISVCWQFTLTVTETTAHGHGRIPFLFSDGSYYWAITCLLQCVWTLAIGWDQMFLSTGLMLGLSYSTYLVYVENLSALGNLTPADMSSVGYAYFWATFPFVIHASWLAVMSLVQVNIFAVSRRATSNTQVVLALLSLGSLLLVGAVAAGSLLATIGNATSFVVLGGHYISSRMTLLVVLLWAARAMEQFDSELSRVAVSAGKKADDKDGLKAELPPLSRLQTVLLQRFKGVVFRCLFGAFVGNVALFAVKCWHLSAN